MLLLTTSALARAESDRPVGADRPPPATEAATWPRLSSGPLQDNSFLIEEAYNQEEGVVQHIASAVRDRASGDWMVIFTQEWPLLSMRHQLSFTLPFSAGEEDASGIGDVLLNYRYQLLVEDAARPAVAPRLSLVLPTGDARAGLGTGSVGAQASLPLSKQIGDHLAAHLNFGVTVIPDAHAPTGPPRREWLTSWNAAGSVIWEPVDAINLLCEVVASRDAAIGAREVTHLSRLTVSPGMRVGWNGPLGTQWVWGVALPVGLTRDTNDLGVFLYFSVEHAFTPAARRARW